jgi:hypothetical protein
MNTASKATYYLNVKTRTLQARTVPCAKGIEQNSLACGLALTVTSKTENSSSIQPTALASLVFLYWRLEFSNEESKRSL